MITHNRIKENQYIQFQILRSGSGNISFDMCIKSAILWEPLIIKILALTSDNRLFNQLLEILIFYCKFEIDDLTGKKLNVQERTNIYYDEIIKLHRAVFERFSKLENFSLANVASVDSYNELVTKLSPVSNSEPSGQSFNRGFFLELISYAYSI